VELARKEAQRLLGQLVDGCDPKGTNGSLFGAGVEHYLDRAMLKPRSMVEARRHLLVHAKPFHALKLAQIDRRAIAMRLAEIEQASGPAARNRVRATLSAFFNFCVREGFCDANPVAGTGRADECSRDRVLTKEEIAKVYSTEAAGLHIVFLDVVRLLLLTGQRREEIAGLRWTECDFEAKVIRLPPSRTKNGREHIIPLSDPAMEILRQTFGYRDYDRNGRVFPSFCWSREKARFDAVLGIAPWRVHDLRRSVATWLNELGFATPWVTEAVLNHQSGHKAAVAGIYNRARYEKETRAALERWAAWLEAARSIKRGVEHVQFIFSKPNPYSPFRKKASLSGQKYPLL
jgi:integrase